MQLACPNCSSRDARVSNRRGVLEYLENVIGLYALRCKRCNTRWKTSTWNAGAWKYARCPQCYRQQLTTWSEQYYHPTRWTILMLRCGATPYRCAPCRCNFTSFRPCKERFSWRKNRPQTTEAQQ